MKRVILLFCISIVVANCLFSEEKLEKIRIKSTLKDQQACPLWKGIDSTDWHAYYIDSSDVKIPTGKIIKWRADRGTVYDYYEHTNASDVITTTSKKVNVVWDDVYGYGALYYEVLDWGDAKYWGVIQVEILSAKGQEVTNFTINGYTADTIEVPFNTTELICRVARSYVNGTPVQRFRWKNLNNEYFIGGDSYSESLIPNVSINNKTIRVAPLCGCGNGVEGNPIYMIIKQPNHDYIHVDSIKNTTIYEDAKYVGYGIHVKNATIESGANVSMMSYGLSWYGGDIYIAPEFHAKSGSQVHIYHSNPPPGIFIVKVAEGEPLSSKSMITLEKDNLSLVEIKPLSHLSTEETITIENPMLEDSNPRLYQNHPNPFAGQTTIGYYLPEGSGDAWLRIINTNGVTIKTINIVDSGYGNVSLETDSLSPGVYFYSLLVDGEIIDTKRMAVK